MGSFDQIIRNEGLQICMGSPSASLDMAEQPHDNEQQHTDLVTGGAPLPLTSDDPGRSAAHIAARPVVRQGPGGAPMVNISHNLRKCTLLEEAPLQDKQQVRRRISTKMRCDDNPQENVEEIFFRRPSPGDCQRRCLFLACATTCTTHVCKSFDEVETSA